jgi:hypothetical protein
MDMSDGDNNGQAMPAIRITPCMCKCPEEALRYPTCSVHSEIMQKRQGGQRSITLIAKMRTQTGRLADFVGASCFAGSTWRHSGWREGHVSATIAGTRNKCVPGERARQVKRDCRDQLDDLLRLHRASGDAAAVLARLLRRVHDRMDARLLVDAAVRAPAVLAGGLRRRHARAAAVPDAADVVPGDDLREPARLDVADLDEPRVEEEHVGVVVSSALGCALPFDRRRGGRSGWVAMPVDPQAKLCTTGIKTRPDIRGRA